MTISTTNKIDPGINILIELVSQMQISSNLEVEWGKARKLVSYKTSQGSKVIGCTLGAGDG